MAAKPLFSILHTSARPDKWRAVYDDWMSKAVHPERVEYVLCVDPRWGFSTKLEDYERPMLNLDCDNLLVVQNTGRRCYVDGVNLAAQASSGRILIVNADDQFAAENWDEALSAVIPEKCGGWAPEFLAGVEGVESKFVIEVDCGGNEHERGIMPMPILSRTRYEQQGFVFFEQYESMSADNDFFAAAYHDGVVIDARHLLFPHKHPMYEDWKGTENDPRWDEAYRAQNSYGASALGRSIFAERKARGFSTVPRSIALCLPGEHFEGAWVDAILDLQEHLIELGFNIMRGRTYTSNPYVTRIDLQRAMMNHTPKPDLLLWLDDDNLCSPAHFNQLLSDLDSHPEVDGVSAWCWIHNEHKTGFMISCGEWSPDHLHWDPFHPSFANQKELRPFDVGGFPCLLIRYSALEKAGSEAFLPVLDNRLEYGLTGEDLSFFLNAEKGGARFLADPQVKVPHLKYVAVEPVFESEGRVPVKVACMIRAKNEGRWIGRTIESVKALCGENIFVMEDGSIDDTVKIAKAAGAWILSSPFVGRGLDESRDKNWLYARVIAACSPDWILMPDGDEELEPGGCEKIRRALETNPPVDCFALRFLYLWDSVDTVRLDGVYGTMGRQSLFRANAKFQFKSYYSGAGHNHVGLHTSNAPGLGGAVAPLNVFLLHYGYLHREDRLRKYHWILTVDPHNEVEDNYRHCIQGDVPEVPADMKLKHSGPLKLSKLPARLVPKFDVVPGPFEPEQEGLCANV